MTPIHAAVLIVCRARPRMRTDLPGLCDHVIGKHETVALTTTDSAVRTLTKWGYVCKDCDRTDRGQVNLYELGLNYRRHVGVTQRGKDALDEWQIYVARLLELHKFAGGSPPHNARAREVVRLLGCKPWYDPRQDGYHTEIPAISGAKGVDMRGG
jgi:hypothetical protein